MARLQALALALLLCPLAAGAPPEPAAITLDGGGPPVANQPVAVTVEGATEALGASLVYNGAFDQGLTGWQRTTGRLGPEAVATVDQGVAILQAVKSTASGTVSVSQVMGHPGNGRFLLRYRAADEGADPTRLLVVLRETLLNGTNLDTRFSHTATARGWQPYEWAWTPRAASGRSFTLFLQANVEPGRTQRILLDEVSLAPVPQVAWSVTGGTVLESSVLHAKVVFHAKGPQAVYANATDGGAPVWSAVGRFTVDNVAPTARLAPRATIPVNQPGWLDATASADPDAPLALQDPTFAALGTTWRTHATSIASFTAVAPLQDPRGGVQVDVAGAKPNATAFLSQTLPPGRATSGFLTVLVQDTGDVEGYSLLVREQNATGRKDTGASFPPTNGREALLELPWTRQLADAASITVLLRFRVPTDGEAHVKLVQPRLTTGLRFAWTLDGEPQPVEGPVLRVLPRAAGPHMVAVNVTDADGAWSAAALAVNYTDPGFLWGAAPPDVAPLQPPMELGLATIHHAEGREQQLRNGDFAAGATAWSLVASDGGSANWTVLRDADGPFARIRATATAAGAVALLQDPSRLCARVACAFSLDYRSDVPLEVVLRERNTTVAGAPHDTPVRAPASAAWRHVEAAWELPPTADRLTVYLRALLPAGGSATVDFRGVWLEPQLDAAAQVSGPGTPQVRNGTVLFTEPGRHRVEVSVANPFGQAERFTRAVQVLPVALFPTPSGKLGLRVLAAGQDSVGSVAVVAASGEERLRLNLSATLQQAEALGLDAFERGGQLYLRAAVAPDDRIVLQSGEREGVLRAGDLLGRFTGPAAAADLATAPAGWSTVARLRIATSDDALLEGTALITEDGREVARVPLHRDGDALVGEARLPATLSRHTYNVTYELRDAWGEEVALAPQALEVAVSPLLAGGLALLLGALLVAAGGWAFARAKRSRGRLP